MVYLKRFIWNRPITHFETLSAQLFFSIPVLAIGSLLLESDKSLNPGILVFSAFAYQVVVVAVLSYLLWFWLIHHFPVTRLAAFTFMAPSVRSGAKRSVITRNYSIKALFRSCLVVTGLHLVNRPAPIRSKDNAYRLDIMDLHNLLWYSFCKRFRFPSL